MDVSPKWKAIVIKSLQMAVNLNLDGSPKPFCELAKLFIGRLVSIGALSSHHMANLQAIEAAILKNDKAEDVPSEIASIMLR